jgi:hypothetical protein
MQQDELRKTLGEPNTCTEKPVTDAAGNKLPVAPCQKDSDWFYSLYYLPSTHVGGGPELLLQFDDQGQCTSSRWVWTQ